MSFVPTPTREPGPPPLGPPTTLLLTADPWVRQQVLTVAEAVGVVVRVDPPDRPDAFWWARAQLVLLGPDADPTTLPGPRAHLVLLGPAAPGDPSGERLDPTQVERLAELLAASRAEADAVVVGVLGAVGGAGASTLASALALTAGRGPCLLVDGDPLGPGLQTALGWEDLAGVRWPDLERVNGRLRPGVLLSALPTRGELSLLSYDRASPALPAAPGAHRVSEVLEAARLDCPVVVVDLPRRCEPADLLVWRALTAAVVVTSGTVGGVVAACRVVETLRGLGPKVAVLVRGGRLAAAEVEPVLPADLVLDWGGHRGLAAAAEAGDLRRALRRAPTGELVRRLWRWAE